MSDKNNQTASATVEVGGIKFTGGKMMILLTALSSAGGTLWGGFEFWKDYQDMKNKIIIYVAPDLSGFDKRLEVIEKNQKDTTEALTDSATKTADYTRDIKNDLKNDIRRLEGIVENIERSNKQTQREIGESQKQLEKDMNQSQKELQSELRLIRKEMDDKIQKAVDNPLANGEK